MTRTLWFGSFGIAMALVGFVLLCQVPANPSNLQAASGSITVTLNGMPIASGPILNLVSGNNTTATASPTTNGTTIKFDANTSTLLSKATDQAGTGRYCHSVSGTAAYTCTLSASQKLTVLTAGMTLILVADTACAAGNCSLVVDATTTAGVSIRQKDGVTAAALVPGDPYLVFYDGLVWRVIG